MRPQSYRKEYGLYLTPVEVANFMAKQVEPSRANVRLLDPAAGVGILCCAAVESLLAQEQSPESVEVIAYEVDAGLIEHALALVDSWSNRLADFLTPISDA